MLDQPLPWLVAEVTGNVVGFAYACRHRLRSAYRWSADCSVYVAPQHRGRAVGRVLYERLFVELRELGYVSLFAAVALPNPISVGLHESLGFRTVGVFRNVGYKSGEWHQVGWWHRPLRDPPESPQGPREW